MNGRRPFVSAAGRRCRIPGQAVRQALILLLLAAAVAGTGALATAQARRPTPLAVLIQQARAGSASAQFILGTRYYFGQEGLPKSDGQAVKWWGKAAAQGYAPAIAQLRWLRNEQREVLGQSRPRAGEAAVVHSARAAPAAPPPDHQRLVRSLQSFWGLYFRASDAQVVDFGAHGSRRRRDAACGAGSIPGRPAASRLARSAGARRSTSCRRVSPKSAYPPGRPSADSCRTPPRLCRLS